MVSTQRRLIPGRGEYRLKAHSDYNLITAKDVKFHHSWRFPKWFDLFISPKLISPSLNVCCGLSQFGDLRLDAYRESGKHKIRPHVEASMYHIPLRDNSQASVFCDPPYLVGQRYPAKPLIMELIRVTRPGGLIIFLHYWFIHPMGSHQLELLEYYSVPDRKPTAHNRVLSINRKVNHTLI